MKGDVQRLTIGIEAVHRRRPGLDRQPGDDLVEQVAGAPAVQRDATTGA